MTLVVIGSLSSASSAVAPWTREAGLALVVLSVVEQRLDAVRAVLAGATVTEVAEGWGVSRQSVHTWLGRYLAEGIGGLADRSRRPANSPRRSGAGVEVAVVEMRRAHPRWGARRIRLELQRDGLAPAVAEAVAADGLPAERTINRILIRHGLAQPRPRKRPKSSFKRFERPRSMQLWGIDIVGGVELVDAVTGELREAKIVTGVDDHSRYCVMAAVVEHATKRATCLAFAQALARFGVPEEVITDNGKQFTNRFGKGGEVLFDKICRKNGITHRLTEPASPNQNGKVERFHGTLRRELLDDLGPMESVQQAQSVIDAWVAGYNSDRPHQALDVQVPVMPDDRFAPARPPTARWSSCGYRPASSRSSPSRSHQPRHHRRWRLSRLSRRCRQQRLNRRCRRSSSSGWCRHQGIWGWRASSSGQGRHGPGRRCGSGPTAT